jgi:AraC-like DNA-binding protein
VEHVYRELPAPAALAAHLRCLWVETTGVSQPAGSMRILPDGCIDVVWRAGHEPSVVGPATRSAFPTIPPGATLVGARFEPGMTLGLLGAPADVLANLDVPIGQLWGHRWTGGPRTFDDTGAEADGLDNLAALLLGRLTHVGEAGDQLVTTTARALVAAPATPLGTLVNSAGLGERQLRRRFEAAIGYGPKTFQRIMRFRRWLDLATAGPSHQRRLTDLADFAGYADQAHLTREVTRLAGLSPAALLASQERATP